LIHELTSYGRAAPPKDMPLTHSGVYEGLLRVQTEAEAINMSQTTPNDYLKYSPRDDACHVLFDD
jgi:hypothetical protein